VDAEKRNFENADIPTDSKNNTQESNPIKSSNLANSQEIVNQQSEIDKRQSEDIKISNEQQYIEKIFTELANTLPHQDQDDGNLTLEDFLNSSPKNDVDSIKPNQTETETEALLKKDNIDADLKEKDPFNNLNITNIIDEEIKVAPSIIQNESDKRVEPDINKQTEEKLQQLIITLTQLNNTLEQISQKLDDIITKLDGIKNAVEHKEKESRAQVYSNPNRLRSYSQGSKPSFPEISIPPITISSAPPLQRSVSLDNVKKTVNGSTKNIFTATHITSDDHYKYKFPDDVSTTNNKKLSTSNNNNKNKNDNIENKNEKESNESKNKPT